MSAMACWARKAGAQRILRAVAHFYDSVVCTPGRVAAQGREEGRVPGEGSFSVGIPHFNRGARIYRPLMNLLDHPAVREVVIVDDGSSEKEFRDLEGVVKRLDSTGRVAIHRREKNLGALLTKIECAERCRSSRVLILDSDNTAFRHYLGRLASLSVMDPETIYGSSWAFPYFPFQELAGGSIGWKEAHVLTRSGVLRRVYIINDGNYLVPRERYIEVASSVGHLPSDVADVMVVNYLWLSMGGRIKLLPGTSYMHRIDASSFWKKTEDASRRRVMEIFARLESGLPWDQDFADKLAAGEF